MNEDNQFSMADVYIMFSVNIGIHSLIFWYMDGLLPGDFGMPKPIYFPFTVLVCLFLHFCTIVSLQLIGVLQIYTLAVNVLSRSSRNCVVLCAACKRVKSVINSTVLFTKHRNMTTGVTFKRP